MYKRVLRFYYNRGSILNIRLQGKINTELGKSIKRSSSIERVKTLLGKPADGPNVIDRNMYVRKNILKMSLEKCRHLWNIFCSIIAIRHAYYICIWYMGKVNKFKWNWICCMIWYENSQKKSLCAYLHL